MQAPARQTRPLGQVIDAHGSLQPPSTQIDPASHTTRAHASLRMQKPLTQTVPAMQIPSGHGSTHCARRHTRPSLQMSPSSTCPLQLLSMPSQRSGDGAEQVPQSLRWFGALHGPHWLSAQVSMPLPQVPWHARVSPFVQGQGGAGALQALQMPPVWQLFVPAVQPLSQLCESPGLQAQGGAVQPCQLPLTQVSMPVDPQLLLQARVELQVPHELAGAALQVQVPLAQVSTPAPHGVLQGRVSLHAPHEFAIGASQLVHWPAVQRRVPAPHDVEQGSVSWQTPQELATAPTHDSAPLMHCCVPGSQSPPRPVLQAPPAPWHTMLCTSATKSMNSLSPPPNRSSHAK